MEKNFVVACLFLTAIVSYTQGCQLGKSIGTNQACAIAKECPDGFRARFIETGCLCVPVRK